MTVASVVARGVAVKGRSRRRNDDNLTMNPSRLFILRPVATTLFMVAILVVGIIAFIAPPPPQAVRANKRETPART